jgi:hypothetical protein
MGMSETPLEFGMQITGNNAVTLESFAPFPFMFSLVEGKRR